jgi:hypothetical protein
MKHRGLLIGGFVLVALAMLGAWIAHKTSWEEIHLPSGLRGEARTNPFYAMEKLVTLLGARSVREAYFSPPATSDVIYVSNWNWDLGESRRRELERWVEAGGRLVLDDSVYWYDEAHFTSWSGIDYQTLKFDSEQRRERKLVAREDGCLSLSQRGESFIATASAFVVCDFAEATVLLTTRAVKWGLGDADGLRAVRVPVGRGTVTLLLSESPFDRRDLLQADQASLFVSAMQLRRGDLLHVVTEQDYPTLPALVWRFGWPVVALAMLALLLALWRNATRFGPLLPAAVPARRSLAEQIRGVGRFAMRHGGGAALHAASRRALERVGRRHIPAFDSLHGEARAAALADAAGVNAPDLALALNPPDAAGPRHFIAAIVQLETVRRRILSQPTGRIHGS